MYLYLWPKPILYKITTQQSSRCTFPTKWFSFQGGNKTFIKVTAKEKDFKVKGCVEFTYYLLETSVQHLIENFFFTVGNVTLKQDVPMGIDPGPFWANLYCIFMKTNQ